jgi:two-component system, sporulation sensor kinase E
VAAREGVAEVRVADNGGGVPPESLPRIFEPYFSTKSQDKGTGLGLYMSKRIIEDHMQGRIAVTNTDAGAVFTVSVPLDRTDDILKDTSPCR